MSKTTYKTAEFILFISTIQNRNINYDLLDNLSLDLEDEAKLTTPRFIIRDILETVISEYDRYSSLVEDCDALQDQSNEDYNDNRTMDMAEEEHELNIDRMEKLEKIQEFLEISLEN